MRYVLERLGSGMTDSEVSKVKARPEPLGGQRAQT